MKAMIDRQGTTMQKMLIILGLTMLVGLAGCEPMGPLPGGQLEGTVQALPEDWSSSVDFDTVQIETRPESPYSINIWAVDIGSSIYIASGSGAQTDWVGHLTDDPAVRLRIGNKLYELYAVKVVDPAELDNVHARYVEKYDYQSDVAPQDAWVYRLDPR